jgi:hypothetical protein
MNRFWKFLHPSAADRDRIRPGTLLLTPERTEMENVTPPNATDPGQPNFTGALVMAIELLKRGARTVDLHEFNMRVRKLGASWTICSIPMHAKMDHAQLEVNDHLANMAPQPVEGEGNDEGDNAGDGAAPANP